MKSNKYLELVKWLTPAAVVSLAISYVFSNKLMPIPVEQQIDAAKVILSLFGTLLGFLLTLLAIVVSLSSNNLIKSMLKSGHYENLIFSSKVLAALYTITITVSLIGLFMFAYAPILFMALVFLSILTTFWATRTTYKFFQILTFID